MNIVQTFNNNLFGAVRAVKIENEVWFVGRDVIEDLGYDLGKGSYTKYIKNYCDEDDCIFYDSKTQDQNRLEFNYKELGQRGGYLINEYAVIDLVLQSQLPQAKQFRRWITHEVIPSVLETGSYGTPKLTERDSAILAVMNSKNDIEFVGNVVKLKRKI